MISIVIPTYNRARYIPKVVESYLMQSYVEEIIFVDDGSTDETRDILRALQAQDERVRLVCHDKNRGLPASRNTGVQHSSGTYVMFGEDDLWLCEGHCQTLLSHLQAGNYDIIAGRLIRVTSLEEPEIALAERKASESNDPLIDYSSLTGNFHIVTERDIAVPFLHACALFKRELFQDLKYDETSYKVTYFREETDFYLRAGASGFKMAFCPHAKSYHLDRRALDGPEAIRGGCGAKTGLKDKMWNQINNLAFAWKNRAILHTFGIDYRDFILRFFWTGLVNTLSRGR